MENISSFLERLFDRENTFYQNQADNVLFQEKNAYLTNYREAVNDLEVYMTRLKDAYNHLQQAKKKYLSTRKGWLVKHCPDNVAVAERLITEINAIHRKHCTDHAGARRWYLFLVENYYRIRKGQNNLIMWENIEYAYRIAERFGRLDSKGPWNGVFIDTYRFLDRAETKDIQWLEYTLSAIKLFDLSQCRNSDL
jgi:hypothetical protein